MKSKINATIIADSVNPQGDRITTYELVFPRFILAELNTHRVFSKNSSSSRAIPFKKMKEMVMNDPFIPIAWQKNHKGMQGTEYFNTHYSQTNDYNQDIHYGFWMDARDEAIMMATCLHDEGLTKQLCNRLLEPFMWHTVLFTGTEFENFFELRCPQYTPPVSGEGYYCAKSWKELESWHNDPVNEKLLDNADTLFKLQHNKGQAEIHMMALAEAMYDAYNESTPKELKAGEWHIPYSLSDEEKFSLIGAYQNHSTPEMTLYTGIREAVKIEDKVREALNIDTSKVLNIKISTARCARLSYQTVGDNPKIDYEADIRLHDMLLKHHHMSPFEHCARTMNEEEYDSYVRSDGSVNTYGWCRNFKGFIQYRHLIENKI